MAEPSAYKIAVIGAGKLGTRIAGEVNMSTKKWVWIV